MSAFLITQPGKDDLANLHPHPALRTRIISALVALAVIVALFYFFRGASLKFLCFFAVVTGSMELSKLLFDLPWRDQRVWMFVLSIVAVFTSSAFWPHYSDLIMTVAFLALGIYGLLAHKRFASLADLQIYIAKTLLSYFYLGLFPSFLIRVLNFNDGDYLFFGFLAIVFAGDIAAYFVGVQFGKHKMFVEISPKKTTEGALGGLFGSVLASEVLCYVLYHEINLKFLLVGACVGFVAQAGDFFESLLKRVSNQKDSGAIMPGHGGVLDRLDGVLYSAPVFFLLMM